MGSLGLDVCILAIFLLTSEAQHLAKNGALYDIGSRWRALYRVSYGSKKGLLDCSDLNVCKSGTKCLFEAIWVLSILYVRIIL